MVSSSTLLDQNAIEDPFLEFIESVGSIVSFYEHFDYVRTVHCSPIALVFRTVFAGSSSDDYKVPKHASRAYPDFSNRRSSTAKRTITQHGSMQLRISKD